MKNIFTNTLLMIILLTITSLLIIIIPEIATLDHSSNTTISEQDPSTITITEKENFYFACMFIGIVFVIGCFILFRWYYLELKFYNWNESINNLKQEKIKAIENNITRKGVKEHLLNTYDAFYNRQLLYVNMYNFMCLHKWKASSFNNDTFLKFEIAKS